MKAARWRERVGIVNGGRRCATATGSTRNPGAPPRDPFAGQEFRYFPAAFRNAALMRSCHPGPSP
jgi:hypothetical protein